MFSFENGECNGGRGAEGLEWLRMVYMCFEDI